MKQRFRLYRRDKYSKKSDSVYYLEDTHTKKRTSLQTTDKSTAERLLHAHREAHQQTFKNVIIARVYLQAADPSMMTRTWQDVMNVIVQEKHDETKTRWERAANDKAFDLIRKMPLLETRSEHLLETLKSGKVSTNVYLRRVQNYAVDMGWLPTPILPKRRFPKYKHKEKRAITWDEHQKIINRETNPERRALYELAWHTGGSQSDLANLHAEDIDWKNRIVSYDRMKLKGRTKTPPQITIGPELETVLRSLPREGHLFPYLRTVSSKDRANEFRQRCHRLGIFNVTLHSYRYAWAKRAKEAGYPERWAQIALGHGSKAMARHYSKNAEVVLPSLESWKADPNKVVVVQFKENMQAAAAQT